MTRRLATALAGLATLALSGAAIGTAGALPGPAPVDPLAELACVAPGDAAGIDRMLAAAGSPMAGDGATLVRESRAVGLDPRALVAIAGHETVLETYAPAAAIRNPFGIGPGWRFADEREAIRAAARILARYYLAEGRSRLREISPKWAPVGAANDPAGLNSHWTGGVERLYARLGGDPGLPALEDAQDPTPPCQAGAATVAPLPAREMGPIVRWDGRVPRVSGVAMADGADPTTGLPATLPGFAFPLAPPEGAAVLLAAGGAEDCSPGGGGCVVVLSSAPGTAAVAAISGRLEIGSPADRGEGIGFWISSGPDRFGYGRLAGYADGVVDGATVPAGAVIGRATGRLAIAWERDGVRIAPQPLLGATRPSQG
jgi:hypothetical protein